MFMQIIFSLSADYIFPWEEIAEQNRNQISGPCGFHSCGAFFLPFIPLFSLPFSLLFSIKEGGKRQIIGVYKKSTVCDILQSVLLDNWIVTKTPVYPRLLLLLRLRYKVQPTSSGFQALHLLCSLLHFFGPFSFPGRSGTFRLWKQLSV